MKENKKTYCIFLAIIGIAFYVLNILTPEFGDDYFYKFIFINHSGVFTERITSIQDIIVSQYRHYFGYNGRFFIHVIVQLFSGIIGKDVFNVINAFLFCFLIFLLTRYTYNQKSIQSILIITILLFLMPEFSTTFLLMTGSINYMWTAVAALVFLLLLRKTKDEEITCKHILLGILSLVLGWTHEGIMFPLAVSLILFSLFNIKTIYKKGAFLLIIGFILGSILCAFSPATLHRGNFEDTSSFSFSLIKVIKMMKCLAHIKLTYILLILLILPLYKEKKLFVKNHIFIFTSIIFSFGILFLSGMPSPRIVFGAELYSLILILYLLKDIKLNNKILIAISCTILVFYIGLINFSKENYSEYKNLVTQITDNNDNTVMVKTNQVQIPRLFVQYIQRPIITEYREYYDGYSFNNYENREMAAAYHKDSLAFIPERFYNEATANPDKYKNFSDYPNLPFYVKEYNGEFPKKCTFILKETDFNTLPFYIRPFAGKMQQYTAKTIDTDAFDIVNIEGKNYLIVSKNYVIDKRVKDIKTQ